MAMSRWCIPVLVGLGIAAGSGRVYGEVSMTTNEVIMSRRSIRRFTREPIPGEILVRIVKAGHFAPTAGNRQPWSFILVDDPDQAEQLFPVLGWLGGAPDEAERPVAYIALLMETPAMDNWSHLVSAGSVLQNIQLAAWAEGIGSCAFGSIDRDRAVPLLQIPDTFHLLLIMALGYPAETPVVTEVDSSLRPQRDETGVLRVPKKNLDDVLHRGAFGH